MSNGHHFASIQAQAAKMAGEQNARATARAAHAQIEFQKQIHEAKEARLKECIENFSNLDATSLFQKSDKELAKFQAEHPAESPQYSLALNEWNRRLVTRQVKATKFSAFVGLAGIIIGAILGWILASYSFKSSSNQFIDYLSNTEIQNKAGDESSE